ncbi:hypothetical protein G7Y89_g892 [Cudoniella acicularis]|uniref:AAA+ ATPase domain-containing protein n=1 Tax=Cudoniella acicularis TaxID=354080 RepID=A0A8H4RXC2_9HELO|nr:hypothetical protein G7Y89_g892 [Cudoniella acicularis]
MATPPPVNPLDAAIELDPDGVAIHEAADKVANPPEDTPQADPAHQTSPLNVSVNLDKGDTPVNSSVTASDKKPDEENKENEENKEAEKEGESWEDKRQRMPKVVDVKWLDFQHFKNRYGPEEGLEIIEVLRGHENSAQEITKERGRRQYQFLQSRGDTSSKATNDIVEADPTWIQRVRIQSPQIILLLSRLTAHGDSWPINRPRVFFRPFRAFNYYLPQMKQCLGILEERWAHSEMDAQEDEEQVVNTEKEVIVHPRAAKDASPDEDDSSSDSSDGDDESKPIESEAAVAGPVANSITALRHVRKYVEFVEEHIMPLWKRAAGTSHRKVRFLDLWMFFQPGELLYVPPISDSSQISEMAKRPLIKMYQTAWRVYAMIQGKIKDHNPDDVQMNSDRKFDVYAYYWDYNGTSYGPVSHCFEITDYEGEKDISTCEVYPMRFVKDSERIKANLKSRGERFQTVVREKHVYYDRWTLTQGPTEDVKPGHRSNSEHIDGEVIVDFVEGFKADSSLNPPPFNGLDSFTDANWPKGDDELLIQHWASGPKSKMLGEIREITQRWEFFGDYLTSRHKKNSKSLEVWEATSYLERLEVEDLILLPRRVVGYAFRERKFVMLDIEASQDVPTPQNVFRDLKIDPDHKRMVKSLVKTHFEKQNMQRRKPNIGLNQDLIRGKGSGLVILLHGVPGVGKTATAEAVAQANKKPLFAITCGNLGFTPKDVETSLRDIFRLAHLWDCVLLLDEADIFLSRQEFTNISAVFLRVLEYYSGILFLTTNRVRALDEAFKSRIHVSLYYPPLSKEQTLAIFEVNIRKLRNIEEEKRKFQAAEQISDSDAFKRPIIVIDEATIRGYAEWHYDTHEAHERWNGRQIRNAFQIAYSLAHFDIQRTSVDQWDEDNGDLTAKNENAGEENNPLPALKLDHRQFALVAKAIEKFDAYLYDAIAGSYMDNSRNQGLRADDHDAHDPSQRGHGQSPQQRPYPASRQEYQPDSPQQRRQRPRHQGTPQRAGNTRSTPWVSPSRVPPQYKPTGAWREDSGYSGLSTSTPDPSAVLGEDEYSENMQGEYQDHLDSHEQLYVEDEEGYQADGSNVESIYAFASKSSNSGA